VKRPKTIWLLLVVFFVPSLANGLKVLFQQSESAEYRLYDAAGISMVLYLLAIAAVAIELAAIRYLWRPEPVGFRLGIGSAVVGAIIVLVTAAAALQAPDALRSLVLESKAGSGVPVPPEVLDFTTSPNGVFLGVSLELVWLAIRAALVVWNRAYFDAKPSVAT
jgi:hypothetical protein